MRSQIFFKSIGVAIWMFVFLMVTACSNSADDQASISSESRDLSTSTPPTLTPSAIPTFRLLEFEDAEEIYHWLNPEQCDLSCFWGIVPGQTTKTEVDELFVQFSTKGVVRFPAFPEPGSEYEMYSGAIQLEFEHEVVRANLEFSFVPNQAVETIHAETYSRLMRSDPRQFDFSSIVYRYLFKDWTMANLVSEYGPPHQIGVVLENSNAEPNSPDFFRTYFLYPDSGTIVIYEASADIRSEDRIYGNEDDYAYVCPADSFVEIWILSQTGEEAISAKLAEITYYWTESSSLPEQYKTVDEALGLTIAEFSNALLSDIKVCFETLVNTWPPLY
jgi:hypothetical protein